jgi:hypothetical protein
MIRAPKLLILQKDLADDLQLIGHALTAVALRSKMTRKAMFPPEHIPSDSKGEYASCFMEV